MARPALFLDRDGTINVEVDYLSKLADLELIPGAAEAIAAANAAGLVVVVYTNQSGIARGMLSEADLDELHFELDRRLALQGARIDAYEYCPHHPEIGELPYRADCACRKPKPGMLLDAARAHGLDLGASWAVGDSLRDLDAARAAGIPHRVLVRTGKGAVQASGLAPDDHVVADLGEAVELVLAARADERG
ncbi:MAG: D-glycero-beta-D-manno-heptose 1,7-bisphosphate 7-phosphatase [Planctomycetota bacterium]|nr:D-glycero-beta-D-manno-heptose 1,7-bisphosphate 7-phosphatase [Planctomycetota bacterium]